MVSYEGNSQSSCNEELPVGISDGQSTPTASAGLTQVARSVRSPPPRLFIRMSKLNYKVFAQQLHK